MDRIHSTLAPKKAEGPPRDIITKFHFNRTKEQLLAADRERNDLSFQGHKYQLFADLSQLTTTKRNAMKPQLLALQNHHIIYQWGFPFSIRFVYQGSKYICRSVEELQQTLQDPHLVESTPNTSSSRRRSASSSLQNTTISSENNEKHLHSQKEATLTPPQEKEMDWIEKKIPWSVNTWIIVTFLLIYLNSEAEFICFFKCMQYIEILHPSLNICMLECSWVYLYANIHAAVWVCESICMYVYEHVYLYICLYVYKQISFFRSTQYQNV